MIQTLNNLIAQAEVLVTAVIAVMALVFVAVTWARTRSAVPTVGALLLGAVVVWGVHNVAFLEQQVDTDIRDAQVGALGPVADGG